MRGRFRESEHVETPPHRAEFGFSVLPCGPLHSPSQTGVNALMARGARNAVHAAPRKWKEVTPIVLAPTEHHTPNILL
jgi:hypothetical protein